MSLLSAVDFIRLSEVAEAEIVDLMNNSLVAEQLPLLASPFSLEYCRAFLDAKQRMWEEHGYGPWAFQIRGKFAGWGGLQPEQGDADFALVLHPAYWGWGRRIFNRVLSQGFNEMGLESVTILLPPHRKNSKAVLRLGFREDGRLVVNGISFRRFRLSRPAS